MYIYAPLLSISTVNWIHVSIQLICLPKFFHTQTSLLAMEISSVPFFDPDDFYFSPNPFNDFDSFNTIKKRRTDCDNLNTFLYDDTENEDETLNISFSFEDVFDTLLIPAQNHTDPQVVPHSKATFEPNVNQTFQIVTEISNTSNPNAHKRSADAMLMQDYESSSSPTGSSPHSQRRLWVKNRSKAWWEQRDSADYPDEEFRKAFRMSKATFDMICKELEPVVNKKDTMLRLAIPVRQRVAVCLWRLATGEPLREVSKRFGLGISTCHKLVLEVCKAIQEVLKLKYIQWPNKQRLNETKQVFESVSGVPQVCGSLYTTHVPIIAPKERSGIYLNKRHTERNQKTSYSISVQGVVDSRRLFTDVSIGWPGSMPDDKVLEKSSLSQRASAGLITETALVGNSGHPLTGWVLTPYTNQNLTWTQHAFNEKIREVQLFAKEAFMRLKARWSCLQKRTEMKLQDLPVVLMACCVLHNICEVHNEELSPELRFELFDDEMVAENGVRSVNAQQYRDQIAHKLLHYHCAAANLL